MYPTATLDTKFGKVNVSATDANHVFVTAETTANKFLRIRGIEYRFNTHMYRHSDGVFRISPEDKQSPYYRLHQDTSMYFSDYSRGVGASPSSAARKSAVAEIEPIVSEFLASTPGLRLLAEGGRTNDQSVLDRLCTKLQELRDAAAAVEAEIATVRARLKS